MRLVAAACTLVIVACLAVFGGILLHERTIAEPGPYAPSPNAATAQAMAPRPLVTSPVSTVTTSPVSAAPVALASIASSNAILPEPQAVVPERPPVPVQSFAQAPARPAPPPAAAPSRAAPPPPAPAVSCPGNPNALGVARVVEVDTLGGPGFGFEHFKSHDFLQPGEVVLTFDDGPWPRHTPAVLAALAAHCTKAIFFPIGKHAMWEPGILKQVMAAGHAVGSHTWSHADLEKLSKKSVQEAKDEIEKGFSAVHWAAGAPTAPYFRFPALRHPPELVTYLGQRNVAIFSTDFDSFDFKARKPEQVRQAVMTKLKKFGKGIILMHDFQQATAAAAAELLNDLKAGGYKVVFMKPKGTLTTIASYDEAILKDAKLPTVSDRPTSSVVRTISE
jgi:peptidoglycan/xylan/chitin deacetylase (PgdA/CDA1 family)